MWKASAGSPSSSVATRLATSWATRPHLQVCGLVVLARALNPKSHHVAHSLAAGQKEQEANNFLEKRYKTDPNPSLTYDDTVQLALACLQTVLGSDLKASDVEVRVFAEIMLC